MPVLDTELHGTCSVSAAPRLLSLLCADDVEMYKQPARRRKFLHQRAWDVTGFIILLCTLSMKFKMMCFIVYLNYEAITEHAQFSLVQF